MGVPIVELRVWTSYPGQFPGQPAALNAETLRIHDPEKKLSVGIEKLQYFENQLLGLRHKDTEAGMLDRIRIRRLQKKARARGSRVLRSIKRAMRGSVAMLESSGGAFYDLAGPQHRRLVETLEKARSIDLFALEAEDLLVNGPRKSVAQARIKR